MVMKMPRIDERLRKPIWIVSIALAAAILSYGLLRFGSTDAVDDFVFFSVIVAVFPSATLNYLDYQWRKAVDEHLPDLFRSIVQAQETGMTLPQAMEQASKRDYGPLTKELKKMNTQISWGMSFEESLLSLGKRVNTVLMQRTVPMVIEAGKSGGRVEKVFDPLGKFVQTTLLLEKERRTQTRPYIAIVYVAFFVFLFTIVMLFRSFFANLQGLSMLATGAVPPDTIERIFFHMTSIQAFFGGLVAGKMGDGSIKAGLKHSLILMLCGYLAIKLFL